MAYGLWDGLWNDISKNSLQSTDFWLKFCSESQNSLIYSKNTLKPSMSGHLIDVLAVGTLYIFIGNCRTNDIPFNIKTHKSLIKTQNPAPKAAEFVFPDLKLEHPGVLKVRFFKDVESGLIWCQTRYGHSQWRSEFRVRAGPQ